MQCVLVGGCEDYVRVAHAAEASGDGQEHVRRVGDETCLNLRREYEVAVTLRDAGESGEATAADGESRLTAVLVLVNIGKGTSDAAEVCSRAHTISKAGCVRLRDSVEMSDVAARSAVTFVVVLKMSGMVKTAMSREMASIGVPSARNTGP